MPRPGGCGASRTPPNSGPSCGLPESPGLCRPVAGGTPDPRGKCKDEGAPSCKTTGLCGVAGECAVYPAGTTCASAGCEGAKAETALPAAFCDGAGRCEMPAKIKCGPGATCLALLSGQDFVAGRQPAAARVLQ